MRYKSSEESIKDHAENYRSDGIAKGKGTKYSADFHRVQFLIASVMELAPDGCMILDAGCNGGTVSVPLKAMKKGCYIKAIDIVPELVEKAKKRGVFAEVGNVEDLKGFKDNTFDVVICAEVLEHLYAPDIAIGEAYRVLKPGGIYLVTVPAPNGEMTGDKLGDYHQQNFSNEIIDTLFHIHFKRGLVKAVHIPYTDNYCRANSVNEEQFQQKRITPQWIGIIATKEK